VAAGSLWTRSALLALSVQSALSARWGLSDQLDRLDQWARSDLSDLSVRSDLWARLVRSDL
jgi:hypothetical protein